MPPEMVLVLFNEFCRFSRDAIVDGPDDPCRGQDRHNGEIASFHLER